MTNCTKEAQNDVVKTQNDVIDSILRADAIAVIRKNHYRLQGKGMTEEVLIADLEALPSAQPEVIRCKDCYHYPSEYADCPMIGWARNENDFCSKAERKNDE